MAFQTLAIGFVMSIEGLNTAVEKSLILFINYHENWFHKRHCQELFFSALTAIIIGLIIYVPLIF
jgi:diacylglycerol kinase (ATP)